MIKSGRTNGWLHSPISTLPTWASFNGVKLHPDITIGPLPGFEERGSTVVATADLSSDGIEEGPLMTVPRELIVSRENVENVAKSDADFRAVLEAVGEFGRTSRGAILLFLLMQTTIANPSIPNIGVLNPLTEYIKFLPDENLPTFWTESELELLTGTTLRPAVRAKLGSLLREFESVRSATMGVSWCREHWWGESAPPSPSSPSLPSLDDVDEGERESRAAVTFDDWMRLDAMYRSRALEFPGVGDCMVPCVDMANHAAGEETAAVYEVDSDGNAVLILREGRGVRKGGEVNITYGDAKGACETLFSYGFLPAPSPSSPSALFLHLTLPPDDPLRAAKLALATSAGIAPGVLITSSPTPTPTSPSTSTSTEMETKEEEEEPQRKTKWESPFIYLALLNEEDGLTFRLAQTTDGETELAAFFNDTPLTDELLNGLEARLREEELWDVYRLRAVVMVEERVGEQLDVLRGVEEALAEEGGEVGGDVREEVRELAGRLRGVEGELLERAAGDLGSEKYDLLQSEVVRRYLGLGGDDDDDDDEQEDFS
ncbi:SET domain-containing protein [Aaosphaeria arxii CBS 175.79]|uniref:SET domain-containing protein n=1 Tax=Aaosphaeria arxii CBS 175.79 TaxID=1450172 RepID=A0A6A5XQ80_9PLEO|nr:SET domain-containing protein [Aaosphaeria arxii CBS 175.79]KAF2015056.1 SET domain-containing protein [Aaosphaeria arxii CBS 175.79]